MTLTLREMTALVRSYPAEPHPLLADPPSFSLDGNYFRFFSPPPDAGDDTFVTHLFALYWLRDCRRSSSGALSGRAVRVTGEDYVRRCLLDSLKGREVSVALHFFT